MNISSHSYLPYRFSLAGGTRTHFFFSNSNVKICSLSCPPPFRGRLVEGGTINNNLTTNTIYSSIFNLWKYASLCPEFTLILF